ncbi:MAG: sulfite exporter TauE/SafE family protein [Nanoarchaeota archaeon]
MTKKTFKIDGMHCNSCEDKIRKNLKDRVNHLSVSYSKGEAEIDFNPDKISERQIKEIIRESGYEIGDENIIVEKKNSSWIGWIILIASLAILFFIIYRLVGGVDIKLPETGQKTSLLLLFLIGLLTGFHCVAMCGGFLISYTAKNAVNGYKSFSQHLIYGASKTISYTIIGALFGLVGSIFFFSPGLRGGIAIFAGVFMIFYSLSIFGIGFFKKFRFNPKFLSKIANKKYSGVYFGPAITGLLNGLFIACGPLQALYLYAAGTGSFYEGGLSLMVFGLGTLPVMLGFGGFASAISHKATKRILKISGIIVLILGLIMLNRGLSLTGTGYDFNNIISRTDSVNISNSNIFIDSEGYQVIKMDVDASGYNPSSFILKKNVPVKWVINGKQITNCNKAIQVPKLNLKFDIKEGEQTIKFTPTEEGVISWSCWMGMIQGKFIVTESGEATAEQLNSAVKTSASSGSCGMNSGGGCGCGM